jgi:membrane-associated HD superfamily phosphohydrolase
MSDALQSPQIEEEILFTKRQHWFVLVPSLALLVFLSLFIISVTLGIFMYFSLIPTYPDVFFSILALTLLFTSTLVVKTIMEWYFHVYTLTSHRIMEVCYSPLFSHWVNDVLLDEVRCTEIDITTHGFINQLFNKGDVVITFDRPTHEEEFKLSNVKDPQAIGQLIEQVFQSNISERPGIIWYRNRFKTQRRIGVGGAHA